MNQKALPAMTFVGLEDYEHYAGGNHGFVPVEGKYMVRVNSCEPVTAKDGIKGMLEIGVTILDTDVGTNISQIARAIYFGVDGKGKTLAKQAADFYTSLGIPDEKIQEWAKGKVSAPITEILAKIAPVGKTAYVDINFDVYNGQLKSQVANFIVAEVYAKAKENNASFRGRKANEVNVMQMAMLQAQAAGGTAATPAFGAQGGAAGVNLGGPGAATFAQPAAAAGSGFNFGGTTAGNNAQQAGVPNL